MATGLMENILEQGLDSLSPEHMQIFDLTCAKNPEKSVFSLVNADPWFKFYQKFKDFLLVSICDEELVDSALAILHNFLISPTIKF
jgi:hypothetical protein